MRISDWSSDVCSSDLVVNILLKRDFEGVAAMARLGASTEGGNVQQQYGILGGKTWSSGNLLAAYDYSRSSAILAGDRSYAIRSEEHTSELQSLMRISYAVFCLKKKKKKHNKQNKS